MVNFTGNNSPMLTLLVKYKPKLFFIRSFEISWSATNLFYLLCWRLLANGSKSVICLCLSERRFGSQLRPAKGGSGDPGGQRAFPEGP